ncbi:carbon-nitrogen hydrolase family protein [Bacillus smithii]|uniref:carbon-nitrogen hydrolase family protein n=1 Tax=Bacillus smithii TaxID=1479 RepID=UPI0022E6CC9C|nr:carbon-nitrogen hydrolase family protein [Bacillus smithii]
MINTHVKVASVQMNCILHDKQKNLEKALHLIEEACQQGAQLIVLPELFNTGYRVEELDLELAESIPGELTKKLEKVAKEKNVHIIGCILEKGEVLGTVYDTAFIVGPNGLYKEKYRKIYLWDQENVRFKKGNRYPVIDIGWAKIGLQICYEVGFPEGARILTLKGADILVYPSAFGLARSYAWEVATRSRALENGVFVIASNRTGIEKEVTEFAGNSRIVDPKGTILKEAKLMDEVIIAEISLNEVTEQRCQIPYLRDLNTTMILNELESTLE